MTAEWCKVDDSSFVEDYVVNGVPVFAELEIFLNFRCRLFFDFGKPDSIMHISVNKEGSLVVACFTESHDIAKFLIITAADEGESSWRMSLRDHLHIKNQRERTAQGYQSFLFHGLM